MAIGKRSGSAALLAAALWLAAGAAGAAEVRGWNFGDFGRILVDWGEPVGYRVTGDGDPVVVEFDRPADGGAASDLAAAARQLAGFVRDAELSPDGRRLTLVPARPLAVNDLATERGVVIDVWPDERAADAAPDAAADAADASPPGPPTPLVPDSPAGAAAPGQIASAGETGPSGGAGGIAASAADAGTSEARPPVPAGEPAAAPPPAAEAQPPADLPEIRVRAGQHAGFSRVVFDWTGPVDYEIARTGDVLTVRFDRAADADTRPTRSHGLDQVREVRQTSRGGPLETEIAVAPNTRVRHFSANSKVVIDVIARDARVPPIASATLLADSPPDSAPDTPVVPAAPAESGTPAADATPTPPSPPVAEAPEAAPPAAPAAPGDAARAAAAAAEETDGAAPPGEDEAVAAEGDSQTAEPSGGAVFDPGMPAAAAVFERAGGLWVAFAAPGAFDVNALLAAGEAGFGPGEVIDARGGFAFRFALPDGRHPQVGRDGTAWRVAAVPRPVPLPQRLSVSAEPDFALGPRLLIPTGAAEGLVTLVDPVAGDELIVVPLHDAGAGLPEARRYAQVRLPRTAQGAVVDPLADGVEVRVVEPGIEITAASGLRLSPPDDAARALMETPASDIDRLFDIDGWRAPDEDFNRRRQALQRALVLGPEEDRERARLDFARFLFAHGQATEALAQLEMLQAEKPELSERLDFVALRGAAEVLEGNVEAAREDLERPALAESAEAALWRAGAAAQARDWEEAAEAFRRAGHLLYIYPSPLRERFLIWAAETWLNRGEPARAAEELAWLADASADASEELAAVAYLRGEIAAARGDVRRAERYYGRAIDGDDSYYRHLAGLALIDFQQRHERIEPAEEIERLEAMRYDWRGDAMEYGVLTRLADAYWRDGQYREALGIWQYAAGAFPETAEEHDLQAALVDRLRGLLAGDGPGADEVSPLRAVSLYREYQDLIPEDERRDRLMRHLAERLVQIDLLGEAGDLLRELVAQRLEGPEKARTGARLAAIRLLDDRPADALDALDLSQAPFDDPELADRRRLLRARALSELEDGDAALALLEGDDSELAEAARLDIAWRAENWYLAARVLGRRIGEPPGLGETMPEEQAERVISYAIALAMAEDDAALDRLDAAFGDAMAETPQAETYALVSRPAGGQPPAGLAAVRRQMAEVDTFETFLEAYRQGRPAVRETN
jgi:hypothetical protein